MGPSRRGAMHRAARRYRYRRTIFGRFRGLAPSRGYPRFRRHGGKPRAGGESRILADIAAVEARAVTKIFGAGPEGVRALDDVSVAIRQNEFFTLLGPSGCGKTTLLRLIAGFEQPTAGEIMLAGEPVG